MRRERECSGASVWQRIRPALLRLSPALARRWMNGSFAPSLPRSPGLCQGKARQGKGAQWPASPHHHHHHIFQLPKGTQYLKRPSLSRLFHPPITSATPLAHGHPHRRCTPQVGTRDVAALKALACGFLRLPPSPAPILLPAPPVFYVSHGTRRGGRKSSVNLCLLLLSSSSSCSRACNTFRKPMCPSAAYHSRSTLPHL